MSLTSFPLLYRRGRLIVSKLLHEDQGKGQSGLGLGQSISTSYWHVVLVNRLFEFTVRYQGIPPNHHNRYLPFSLLFLFIFIFSSFSLFSSLRVRSCATPCVSPSSKKKKRKNIHTIVFSSGSRQAEEIINRI